MAVTGNDNLVTWFSAGMRQVPVDNSWLEPALAERLAGMPYTKRREEARLGRWTAKVAIARALQLEPVNATLRDIVVRNASDGAPHAFVAGEPLEAVIAMTDRADWAVCALLPGEQRVGCDLELVEPRSDAFVRDYFTEFERKQVGSAREPHEVANLIWSAKESALKVLRTGLRRDTRSVTVELAERDGDVQGWHALSVSAEEGAQFSGWWIRHGSFLLTIVTEQPTPPPVSMDTPAALCAAEPSHGWLSAPLVPRPAGDNAASK